MRRGVGCFGATATRSTRSSTARALRATSGAGWRCRFELEQAGTVDGWGGLQLRVAVDDGPAVQARVDSRTEFVGLDRHGVAYLGEGQQVAVRVHACERADGRTIRVAAEMAAAAGA